MLAVKEEKIRFGNGKGEISNVPIQAGRKKFAK